MNIFLTTLFVVFALNLFGLFEIQIAKLAAQPA
jgi:thiol:disulfide interchange protein